jgi:hypothetical protein
LAGLIMNSANPSTAIQRGMPFDGVRRVLPILLSCARDKDAEDAARRLFDERVAVSTVTKALEEKREAEETWRAERAENDLLRERIAEIAAQVAHMSMDKAGSPIAEILEETASIRPAGFERVSNGDDGRPPEGSLTDRIRKLQKATSRVSSAS